MLTHEVEWGLGPALKQHNSLSSQEESKIARYYRCTACCRVAYMAEQNCRKSAEARLDAELRKLYKLQAQSQELAFANTKLQQQLKASKNAVRNPFL